MADSIATRKQVTKDILEHYRAISERLRKVTKEMEETYQNHDWSEDSISRNATAAEVVDPTAIDDLQEQVAELYAATDTIEDALKSAQKVYWVEIDF